MKQFLRVSVKTFSTPTSVVIHKVYEADGKLYVLTRVKPIGMDIGGGGYFSGQIQVDTSAAEILPVVYVMMGVSDKWLEQYRDDFVTHYALRGENAQQVITCEDKVIYSNLPSSAVMLYQLETDKLQSFRLEHASLQSEEARPVKSVTISPPLPPLNNVLNMYPMYSKGLFGIVLESITVSNQVRKPRQLFPRKPTSVLDFDRSYLPAFDEEIYFTAQCNGEIKQFCTSACLLSLPAENITAFLYLLKLLDTAIKSATDVNDFRFHYQDPYDAIVITSSSILQCYKEVLLTSQKINEESYKKNRQIINDLPVSIETFVYQPNHFLQPDKVRDFLIGQITGLQNAPEYKSLQTYIASHGSEVVAEEGSQLVTPTRAGVGIFSEQASSDSDDPSEKLVVDLDQFRARLNRSGGSHE